MKQEYYLLLKENEEVKQKISWCKNGKNVYNYVSYTDAKTQSEGLYTKAKNNVISRLCSTYAWDTALKFIETKYEGYATNGKGSNYYGNYADVSFTYTAIDGTTKTKTASSDETGIIVPTGQTTPVNNIYDMGGNVLELNTGEVVEHPEYRIQRGGAMSNNSEYASAFQDNIGDVSIFGFLGFRITLFL